MAGIHNSRLRQTREALGLKQADVASAVGISRSFLSDIESGKKDGSFKTVVALAQLYNVSLDFLAGTTVALLDTRTNDSVEDEDERSLVDAWRSITDEDRAALRIALRNARIVANKNAA